MPITETFAVHLRRENNYETSLVVRFEVLDGGMGVLGLRTPGRSDPPPQVASEESGIEVSHLRAGRFVHVTPEGVRQSYAMSRITEELVEKLSESWLTLDAVTEYGFRYLVVPEKALGEAEPAAAVQLEPVKDSALDDKLGIVAHMLKAPRPKSVASVSGTGTSVSSSESAGSSAPEVELPPRPTAIAPALAQSALSGLSAEQAIEALKTEMTKVEELHRALDARERQLLESRQREADLLDVLSKWQRRS